MDLFSQALLFGLPDVLGLDDTFFVSMFDFKQMRELRRGRGRSALWAYSTHIPGVAALSRQPVG